MNLFHKFQVSVPWIPASSSTTDLNRDSLVRESPDLEGDLDRDQRPDSFSPPDGSHGPFESTDLALMLGDEVSRESVGPELSCD